MTHSQTLIREADEKLARLSPPKKERPAFKLDDDFRKAAEEVAKVLNKEKSSLDVAIS